MAILKSAKRAEGDLLKIAGIGVLGGIAIYALIKSAPAIGDLFNKTIGAITSGISAGFPSFTSGGGSSGTSPTPPPNTFQTPNTFGPGTDHPIDQSLPTYHDLSNTGKNQIPINVPTTLPPDPYVSKGPYTLPTFLAIAKAQGQPDTVLQKGSSGGYIGLVAEGSGQQIKDILLTRGNVLNAHLATMPDVISGLISTEVGGTRQVTGSPGLFQRLAENLGVQATFH